MTTEQDSSPGWAVHRRRLEWAWYGISLLYCCVRVYLADRYVRRYGLDVPAFAVVEFSSTVPYAVGTARLVGALVDRAMRRATFWGLVASAGFVAPDLFTLVTADRTPGWLVAVIVVWLCGATVLAVHRLRKSVVERRRRRAVG